MGGEGRGGGWDAFIRRPSWMAVGHCNMSHWWPSWMAGCPPFPLPLAAILDGWLSAIPSPTGGHLGCLVVRHTFSYWRPYWMAGCLPFPLSLVAILDGWLSAIPSPAGGHLAPLLTPSSKPTPPHATNPPPPPSPPASPPRWAQVRFGAPFACPPSIPMAIFMPTPPLWMRISAAAR